MTDLNYHILGYNHDFGVIRIEGGNCSEKEVVVFPSQPITSSLRLNHREILFVSKVGECARLNLETGDITQKSKTFPHYHEENKLLIQEDGQTLCSVTNGGVSLIDLPSLTIKRTLNVVFTEDDGTLRLHDYDDIKGPYEAKAEEEKKLCDEHAKANPDGPWLKREWVWATTLRWWPENHSKQFRLSWDQKNAALQDNNTLVIPCKRKVLLEGEEKKETYKLGITRIDIKNETLKFEMLEGFSPPMPLSASVFRKMSSDGKALLLDRAALSLQDPTPSKFKKLFGAKRKSVFEHHMEIWRIEDKMVLDRYVSLGTTPSQTQPLEPPKEQMVKYPELYRSNLREFEIDKCRLEAAKKQFKTVFESLAWSKEQFRSDFQKSLSRKKIKIDRKLEAEFKHGQRFKFETRSFIVENFLQKALIKKPDFLDAWRVRPLNQEQLDIYRSLTSIRGYRSTGKSLYRFIDKSVNFEWRSIHDPIHIIEKEGHLRIIKPQDTKSESFKIEGENLSLRPTSQFHASCSRHDGDNLFFQSTIFGGHSECDGFLIDLPISPISKEDKSYIPTQRVYDREKFVKDHEVAEKLARKARKGFITIRSKSAANLMNGLSKLTPEYAKYYDEIILSNRWDAGLYHKGNLILEKEITKTLTKAKDLTAIPVLADFIRAIMWVSAKKTSGRDDLKIEPYPRNMDNKSLDWRVWHNDDGTQVGMPSVNALIALSKTVPELALTFYRYRDFEHDVYTDDTGLMEDVLPHVNLEKPGMLKLLAITSFQLLATGRVQNDLFAQHGMNLVAEALESGDLSPKLTAQIFVQEIKGMQGNLSWGQNLGPAGLVAQVVHGLDGSSSQIKAFGQAMLDIYPEAREFLEKKLAS